MRSFAEVHPELVEEWSAENAVSPYKVSYGSNKAIIWNGSCGHTWTATPHNRSHGHGCPICSDNKIVPGLNDLASQYPDVAVEWSDRNSPAMPSQFTSKSNREFWWICSSCSREWRARIADRTEGHGCPFCLKDSIENRKQERKEAHIQRVQQARRSRHIASIVKTDEFRIEALKYYVNKTGLTVMYDYDYGIGIPVQIYIPEKKAVIELTPFLHEGWTDWRYENAKNWLCLKTGVKMVRIIPQRMKKFENCKCVRIRTMMPDALDYAIRQALKKVKAFIDVDVNRDYEEIRMFSDAFL